MTDHKAYPRSDVGGRQIVYQNGRVWISNACKQYTVYIDGVTSAQADSSYPRDDAGYSIALARCEYLAKRLGR